MSNFRIESDSMGELKVPVNALYQAQTQRAVNNFAISALTMPAQFQEYYLRRTHHEIINKMCDPLTHNAIRKQCLNQLHKPLLALKRFYISHNSRAKFLLLEREARILSHEFNPF